MPPTAAPPPGSALDVAIVGAGFAGLYALKRLRDAGFSVHVVDAAPAIGGTWFWNRYPGARCDIESLQYSYSWDAALEQDWTWSERFATQPEILRYINHVADRFGLRDGVTLNTRVTRATFDDSARLWTLTTDRGPAWHARFVIFATGCLSAARLPDIPGRDTFAGTTIHTADWPADGADLAGQRVAVIGTGSSAIQAIPEIARVAAHLTVYQRTPNFSLPARNAPLAPATVAQWKRDYPELRRVAREETRAGTLYDWPKGSAHAVTAAEREAEFEARWQKGGANFMYAFNDLLTDEQANAWAADFVRRKIRAAVHDPETAAALTPTDYPIFTKRICVDTGYYETFNRPNVTLVNLRKTPITAITATGIRTTAGEAAADVIVYATGFDAMTGALTQIDIVGTDGRTLRDRWAAGPRSYLGLMSQGFPNLFTVTGPGSPSVLSNVIVSIEQHVDWIARALDWLRARRATRIEPTAGAVDAWVAHVNDVAAGTLMPRAASWYMGANIPGKARVFMPYIGVAAYRKRCEAIAAAGYEGFAIDRAQAVEAAE